MTRFILCIYLIHQFNDNNNNNDGNVNVHCAPAKPISHIDFHATASHKICRSCHMEGGAGIERLRTQESSCTYPYLIHIHIYI